MFFKNINPSNKRFKVYRPRVYTEIYTVEAADENEAMRKVQGRHHDAFLIGECTTGRECFNQNWVVENHYQTFKGSVEERGRHEDASL